MYNKTELANLSDRLTDLVNHDVNDLSYLNKDILKNSNFTDAEMIDLKSAFSKLLSDESLTDTKKANIISNSWKVNFTEKPPSMSEFLTQKYIGVTADGIFDYVKSDLNNFFDINNDYSGAVLYPHIRYGKTLILIISLLYISTHYYYMRDPHKFLGVTKASYNVIALIAFNLAKCHELMIAPALNILATSEKFHRCRDEEKLLKSMQEPNTGKIFYSTAVTGSAFRVGNLPFKQISDTNNLIGLALLGAGISELAFFQKKGWSQESILDLFNTVVGRIELSFPNNYYARWVLDSSPYDSTNLIEKYINEDAPKDPKVMIRRGSVWTFQKWKSPIYEKDPTQTFPVFIGSESQPPKIIVGGKESAEYEKYPREQVIDVPVDYKKVFTLDIQKSLRDYAGLPSSAPDTLVNKDNIEPVFSPQLKNIYSFIHAPANLPPEGLIWNRIKDKFFYKTQNGKYEFYRNPNAPRYVSVDQSFSNSGSGDATGIAVSHVEMNKKGELVYVTDMSICIVATKEQINLEAIKFFIRDLRKEGTLHIAKVSFDSFQSASTKQYLTQHGFDVVALSVDSSTEPYLNYLALMSRRCVKMGKNIVFKNNLKSLVMTTTKTGKPKVDHTHGEVPYDDKDKDWKDSKMGMNAKDVADAVVASVYLCDQFGSRTPSFIWEEVETEADVEKLKMAKLNEVLLKRYSMKRNENFNH